MTIEAWVKKGMIDRPSQEGLPYQNALIAAAGTERFGGSVRTLHRDDRLDAGQGVVWFPLDAVVRAQTPNGLLEGWTDYRGAVGLSEVLGGPKSDTVWIVEKSGSALSMPAEPVQAMLERSAGFQRSVIAWLAHSEHAARRRAAFNLTATAADRVRRVVKFVLSIHGDRAPLTQGELGAYTGTQRTTVNAVMRDMRAEGLVSYSRGKVRSLGEPSHAVLPFGNGAQGGPAL